MVVALHSDTPSAVASGGFGGTAVAKLKNKNLGIPKNRHILPYLLAKQKKKNQEQNTSVLDFFFLEFGVAPLLLSMGHM